MRLLVSGNRGDVSSDHVIEELDKIVKERGPVELLIHSGKPGEERSSAAWARQNRIPELIFLTSWRSEKGKAARKRNIRMLKHGKPDLVVAFTRAKEVQHMAKAAAASSIEVVKLPVNGSVAWFDMCDNALFLSDECRDWRQPRMRTGFHQWARATSGEPLDA